MKVITFILLAILTASTTSAQNSCKLGQAFISYYQINYDNSSQPWSYDNESKHELNPTPLSLKKLSSGNVLITNTANSGYSGNEVIIELNEDLCIKNVTYREWTDVVDGSTTEHAVERIILELSKDPFSVNSFEGYYSLLIRNIYEPGELLRSEGVKEQTFFSTYAGKFQFIDTSK